ncbi:ISL3 family transposase [Sphingobium sp. YR768]|uniref:ISL3 family transposase n=1 Tax=Sphingobium sp. YR768 TaxID=1884365 RepID=UPI00210A63D0|nr:ISL3 family transposase [Sphingobium sp. YR768]
MVKNGTKAVRYRDRRRDPAPTWLVVKRQRMKCHSCGKTLYQDVPHMDDRHYITARLRYDIAMSSAKRTFADVSAMHGVEETLARRVFRSFADEKLLAYRYDAPRVLGIDENHVLGGARGVIVDVGKGLLLDVLPGRTQSDVRRGFMERMDNWQNVEVWCQDMAGAYKGVATDLFPKALVVVDKFHVVMKANYWWNRIRVAETPKLPKEAREKIPGLIRAFDRHWDQMKRGQQDRVAEFLEYSPRLKTAWTIKEHFYYFYDAKDREAAEKAYTAWVQFAMKNGQHAEWKRLMTMMQRWKPEIFNYFDHRWTSAKVERLNRSIKDINRAANGMDFQTLRAKALLRHGQLIAPKSFTHYHIDTMPTDLIVHDLDWLPEAISTPFAG